MTEGLGPQPASDKWSDLTVRLGSAAGMALVGGLAIWLGGLALHLLAGLICGLMTWELVRMLAPGDPSRAVQLGVVTGAAVLAAIYLPLGLALPVLAAPAVLGARVLERQKGIYLAYTLLLAIAGYGLVLLRDGAGLTWMLWLVGLVIATDVLGYFAGRMIGGPKFWPRVSPKKTWSGTAAGWVGAGLVGLVAAPFTGVGAASLALVSVLLSLASQLGDIAESAIKRRMGVKDSSALIPGHGGLLDRFDGMMGAAFALTLITLLTGFPMTGQP